MASVGVAYLHVVGAVSVLLVSGIGGHHPLLLGVGSHGGHVVALGVLQLCAGVAVTQEELYTP